MQTENDLLTHLRNKKGLSHKARRRMCRAYNDRFDYVVGDRYMLTYGEIATIVSTSHFLQDVALEEKYAEVRLAFGLHPITKKVFLTDLRAGYAEHPYRISVNGVGYYGEYDEEYCGRRVLHMGAWHDMLNECCPDLDVGRDPKSIPTISTEFLCFANFQQHMFDSAEAMGRDKYDPMLHLVLNKDILRQYYHTGNEFSKATVAMVLPGVVSVFEDTMRSYVEALPQGLHVNVADNTIVAEHDLEEDWLDLMGLLSSSTTFDLNTMTVLEATTKALSILRTVSVYRLICCEEQTREAYFDTRIKELLEKPVTVVERYWPTDNDAIAQCAGIVEIMLLADKDIGKGKSAGTESKTTVPEYLQKLIDGTPFIHAVHSDDMKTVEVHSHGRIHYHGLEFMCTVPNDGLAFNMSYYSAYDLFIKHFKEVEGPCVTDVAISGFKSCAHIDDTEYVDRTDYCFHVSIIRENCDIDEICGQYLPYRYVKIFWSYEPGVPLAEQRSIYEGKIFYTEDSDEVQNYLTENYRLYEKYKERVWACYRPQQAA